MATQGLSLDPASLIQMLLGNQATQEKQTQESVGKISGFFDLADQKAQESIDQQRAVVNDAAVTAGAKAGAEYAQRKLMQDLQVQFGMNPDDANNEIAKSLATVDQVRAERAPIRAEYDQLASTDLLTNPIGYLLAQLRLPTVAAKNNALADAEDTALQNIATRTQQLAAVKNTLTANTADTIRDIQVKEAEQNRKLADARLTGEEAKVSVQRAANQMNLFQLQAKTNDDRRSTIVAVSSVAGRAEAREDARLAREENRADREEGRRLRNLQLDELLNKKKEDKNEEDRLNVRLLTVSQSLGLREPMTIKQLKTLTNKKEQMAWLQAAQTGQYGDDLKDSLAFYLGRGNRVGIQQGGGASILLGANQMAIAAKSYEVEAHRQLMVDGGGRQPKQEEVEKRAFELYQQSIPAAALTQASKEDLSAVRWDHTYNPYQAQFLSFNKAVNDHPELKPLSNNLMKTTIDDMVKSGAVTTENLTASQQQQVLAGIMMKVNKRELSPKQAAAEISTYYKAAVDYNQQLAQPELFGLPPQTAYMFTLSDTMVNPGAKKTNMLDPSAVENAIIWKLKKSLSATSNPFLGLQHYGAENPLGKLGE